MNEKNIVVNNNVNVDYFKKFKNLFKISIILFLVILMIDLIFIKLYASEQNGMDGLVLFLCMIITGIPLLVLITLSIINIVLIITNRIKGISIPTNIKILGIINIFLVPCIIGIFLLGCGIKKGQNDNIMTEKLNELYGNSYTIIDSDEYSNTGGYYYIEYLLKLSNFEYPIVAHIDLNDNSYKDNYDELLKTKQLNYQTYIDNIFRDKTIALMDLYESDTYKSVKLNILMTREHLKDKNLLKQNIQQVINKYINYFCDYDLSLSIYFTEKIDDTKIDDYFTLLTPSTSCAVPCYEKFTKKINKSDLKHIYFLITDNTDINQEIETEIKKIKDNE